MTCFHTTRCLCLTRACRKVQLLDQARPTKVRSVRALLSHHLTRGVLAAIHISFRVCQKVVLRVTWTLRSERSWRHLQACRALILRALQSDTGRAVRSNLTNWLGIQAPMVTLMRHVVESGTNIACYAEKDITQPFKVVLRVHRGPTCLLHSGSATGRRHVDARQAAELINHQTFVLANYVATKWIAASCYTWVLHTSWRASLSILS